MAVTRVVRLRPDLRREPELNLPTRLDRRPSDGKLDGARLFEDHYVAIRAAWRRYDRPGVLILAFDRGPEPAGEVWLEASLDRSRAAIVGRHSLCELLIPSQHAELSLRHLAVVVRATSLEDLRTRVIDLATGAAFADEAGRTLHAVSSDGPMFLQVGPLALALLQTHEGAVLPEGAAEAYRLLPERVFSDAREGRAEARPRRAVGGARGQTIVRAGPGPVISARDLCGEDEPPIGSIVARGRGGALRRPVGASALERGILVGRYERCDLGGVPDEQESELSRVHLLLLRDGEQVLAIDTASTNGTSIDGRMRRVATLQDGSRLALSGELELVWSFS